MADLATSILVALKLAGLTDVSWGLALAPSLVVFGAGLFFVLVMGTADYFDRAHE